eukprot:COSAG04_NODE_2693_length_3724_cov_2.227034_2_plen_99_part_00
MIALTAGDTVVVTDKSDPDIWDGYVEGKPEVEGLFDSEAVELILDDLVADLFADGGSLEEAERVVRLRLEREARLHGAESVSVAPYWFSLGTVFRDGD